MNERIKQLAEQVQVNEQIQRLAEQAGCTIDRLGYGEGNLEKFAELIVRECADICFSIDKEYEGEDVLATWCADGILKHFGVEE